MIEEQESERKREIAKGVDEAIVSVQTAVKVPKVAWDTAALLHVLYSPWTGKPRRTQNMAYNEGLVQLLADTGGTELVFTRGKGKSTPTLSWPTWLNLRGKTNQIAIPEDLVGENLLVTHCKVGVYIYPNHQVLTSCSWGASLRPMQMGSRIFTGSYLRGNCGLLGLSHPRWRHHGGAPIQSSDNASLAILHTLSICILIRRCGSAFKAERPESWGLDHHQTISWNPVLQRYRQLPCLCAGIRAENWIANLFSGGRSRSLLGSRFNLF